MKEKTRTCPTGLSGIMRMMMKGMSVSKSLPVRLTEFTSLRIGGEKGQHKGQAATLSVSVSENNTSALTWV